MNDSKWIEDLRRKEAEYEIPAPDSMWADIDRRLSAAPVVKRRVALARRLRYAAVAAAACIAVVVGVSLFVRDMAGGPEQGDKIAQPVINKPLINIVSETAMSNSDHANAPIMDNVDAMAKSHLASMLMGEHATAETALSIADSGTGADDPEAESAGGVNAQPDTLAGTLPAAVDAASDRPQHRYAQRPENARPHKKANRGGGLRLVAYAGNLMSGANSRTAGRGMSMADYAAGSVNDAVFGGDPVKDFSTINQNKQVDTREHHNLPLRFGINVSVPLSRRVSIETGLTYSILSSTITSDAHTSLCESSQRQHYLGVPLRVAYVLARGNRWSAYASGGGMVEKSVYGRSRSRIFVGDSPMTTTSSKVSERELQLSVAGAAGVRYRVAGAVNVFVEPGVSYYFDNHSGVSNSYKAHPLNFDLKLGVSFDIK